MKFAVNKFVQEILGSDVFRAQIIRTWEIKFIICFLVSESPMYNECLSVFIAESGGLLAGHQFLLVVFVVCPRYLRFRRLNRL